MPLSVYFNGYLGISIKPGFALIVLWTHIGMLIPTKEIPLSIYLVTPTAWPTAANGKTQSSQVMNKQLHPVTDALFHEI